MKDSEDLQYSTLEDNIGYLIYRTGLRVKLLIHRVFNENGYPITTDQWGILQVLFEKSSLSQKELGYYIVKDKANVTRILNVMEKNNLISRKADERDRRKHLISLTDEAVKITEHLLPLAAFVRDKAQESISQKDADKLKSMVNQIYVNLE